MDFDFDPELYSYRDAVRDALRESLSSSTLRAIWGEAHDYDGRIWSTLSELGLPGVLVSDDLGGGGAALADLPLMLEEFGYFAVPEPVVETMVLAPLVLAAFGSAAARENWLPGIADGSILIATQWGDSRIVADGARADGVLVVHDSHVHLVPRRSVRARAVRGADPSRRLAICEYELSDETLLSTDPRAGRLLRDLGAAGTASLLVGVAQRLADMTREYLLQREQFGRLIGSFQALKHRMADVAVQIEAARSLTWYAAYALSEDLPDASIAASAAKASANQAATIANYAALQLHGGIGFTWEHDLHLWLQRGRALEAAFGSTSWHRDRIGAHVLEGASA